LNSKKKKTENENHCHWQQQSRAEKKGTVVKASGEKKTKGSPKIATNNKSLYLLFGNHTSAEIDHFFLNTNTNN